MKTTVIIPTYNRAALLERAIASLLRQTCDADLDILVIDDGSQDETQEVLTRLCHSHAEIRAVRRANGGVTAARNTGLANLLPETEFVTFLDSDDISPVGRFARDLPRFAADPILDFTYGRMMLVDQIDEVNLVPTADSRKVEVVGIHLSAAIFRRDLVDRIGPFDEDFRQAEDTDYLLRIFESGARFEQTETLCLYYRRHEYNMTRDTNLARRSFSAAILKSVQRRKNNHSICLSKPRFDVQSLAEVGFF
jgi:glycosyltransferase involved in cell wall biosynthesis